MAVRWILINENDEPVDPENHLEEALKDAENLVSVLRSQSEGKIPRSIYNAMMQAGA